MLSSIQTDMRKLGKRRDKRELLKRARKVMRESVKIAENRQGRAKRIENYIKGRYPNGR